MESFYLHSMLDLILVYPDLVIIQPFVFYDYQLRSLHLLKILILWSVLVIFSINIHESFLCNSARSYHQRTTCEKCQ